MPFLINKFISFSFCRELFKNQIGLIDFPLYSPESVRKRLLNYDQTVFNLDDLYTLSAEESKNSVILLQDAFTSFYESQVVVEFYQLLKKLGFSVYVAPFHPNGKPLHVKGFLNQFSPDPQITSLHLALRKSFLDSIKPTNISLRQNSNLCRRCSIV